MTFGESSVEHADTSTNEIKVPTKVHDLWRKECKACCDTRTNEIKVLNFKYFEDSVVKPITDQNKYIWTQSG